MFKKGDLLVYVDAVVKRGFTKRNVYKADEDVVVHGMIEPIVEVKDDQGLNRGVYVRRFVLASEYKDFQPGDKVSVNYGNFRKEIFKFDYKFNGLFIPMGMLNDIDAGKDFTVIKTGIDAGRHDWFRVDIGLPGMDKPFEWTFPIEWLTYVGPGEQKALPVVENNPVKNDKKKVIKKPRPPKKDKKVSIRKVLREEQAKTGRGGLCSYAIQFASNKYRLQVNDVCHARLPWGNVMWQADHEKEAVAVALNISRYNLNEDKSYRAFVKYILNESPVAHCFKTKSVAIAMKHGILMNVDVPLNEIAIATVMLREHTEYPARRQVFQRALDLGFSGKVAYLASCIFLVHGDGFLYVGQNSGHRSWSGVGIEFHRIIGMMRNGFADVKAPIYRKANGKHYQLDAHIEKACSYTFSEELKNKYSAIVEVGNFDSTMRQVIPGKNKKVKEGWYERDRKELDKDAFKTACEVINELLTK